MLDRGDATVADIDVSMQLGAGHPMGPLQLADYIGLDTLHHILSGWLSQHPEEPAFVMPECKCGDNCSSSSITSKVVIVIAEGITYIYLVKVFATQIYHHKFHNENM